MSNNMLDVRDLIERFEELETELIDCFNDQQETEGFTVDDDSDEIYQAEDAEDELFISWLSDCSLEEAEEYRSIKNLLDELEGNGGDEQWRGEWYPLMLINEDYFTEYCTDLVSDIGDLPRSLPAYIENNIDWDGVADDLKVDYYEVDYQGETYYYR